MTKDSILMFVMMLIASGAWAQISIPDADTLKHVTCSMPITIPVNNSGNATYIAAVSGGLVILDNGREKTLVITNSPSVTISAATGPGRFFVVNATTGQSIDSARVVVNPVVVSNISGPECIDEAGSATYSVTPTPGIDYLWVVQRGGMRITSGQGTNSVTVQSTSRANSLLRVYYSNACIPELCGAPSRAITIRKTFPNPFDGLIGPECLDPATLAANDSIIAFFVEPVLGGFSGANNNDYLWNIPALKLQHRFSSPDGSARAFKVLDASQDFSISLTVGAKCNPGNIVTKDINVPPPTPVMAQADYCFLSTATTATLSVDPAYHKPDYSYQWILPLNWQFADADTTTPTVNVIMDTNPGNVTVIATNAGCGQTQNTFTVNRAISNATITTTNGACVTTGDVTEKTYSVSIINNNQYIWTLPAGWTFKPGTPTNTSSVTVIPSGTNGGAISVSNAVCGGQVGHLNISISSALSVSISEAELSPEDLPNHDPGLYYYGVPNTMGSSYTWAVYNRNTGMFLHTPTRRSASRPHEVFLDQLWGFGGRILATDSLVVTIRETSGCETTKYTVRENYTSSFSAFSSARTSAVSTETIFDVSDIDGASGNNEFSVYPNPAKELVTVTSHKIREAGILSVMIMDIHGNNRKVVDAKGKKKVEIDTSDLPPSTYVILIRSDHGVVYEKLIIN